MTAARKWRYGEMSNAVIDERGRLIASLDGRDSDGEDVLRADGVLLAAAPNVVEKARALLVAIDSHFPDEPFLRAEVEALAAALDAATKVQS